MSLQTRLHKQQVTDDSLLSDFHKSFLLWQKQMLSAMAILSYSYDCNFRQLQELAIQKSPNLTKTRPFYMSTFAIWLDLQYSLQKKRVQLALVQPKN